MYKRQGINSNAQSIIKTNENIDIPSDLLTTFDYKSAIENKIGRPIEYYYKPAPDSLVYSYLHPVIAALDFSFCEHRPFTISPDIVWLMITQSFAIHLQKNPDKYKNNIVDFNEKKLIQINKDDFSANATDNDWHEILPIFSDSLKTHIGDTLYLSLIHI